MSTEHLLNGRADEAQFAQNPLPVAHAMGVGLGSLHTSEPPTDLPSRTPIEVDGALRVLETLGPDEQPPHPFGRVRVSTLQETLAAVPAQRPLVVTHGAPIVSAAVLVDSIVTFEDAGCAGLDPAERDLAIVIRSLSETFTSEVSRTFLDGYLEAGGELPHAPTLDWYALVAAFR